MNPGLIVLFFVVLTVVYLPIAYVFWLWPFSIGQLVIRIKGLIFSIHIDRSYPTLFVGKAGSFKSRDLSRFDLSSKTPEAFKAELFATIDHYLKQEIVRQDKAKELKRLKKLGSKMYMAEKFSKPL